MSDERKKKNKSAERATLGQLCHEVTQRFGEAGAEYIKGYNGFSWKIDSTGQSGVAKGLKDVAKSKVNPKFEKQNLKQQSGFSGEILATSKKNAENIISGKGERFARSNDVGRGNDRQVDIAQVNKSGDFVVANDGTVKNGVQAKISGKFDTKGLIENSAQKNVRKMINDGPNGWARYDKVALPSEQVPIAREYALNEANKLSKKAAEFKKQGDIEKADLLSRKAEKFKEAANRIEDLGIRSEEAMDARLHPLRTTLKNVGKTAHRAGMEQLSTGAAIGGAISASRNMLDVVRGNKKINEAVKDIAVDTAEAGATSYAIAAGGSLIKSGMSAIENQTVKTLSRSSMPAVIATAAIEVGNSFRRFAKGEIDEMELAKELGEKGTGMMAASWCSAVGTVIMPGIGTIAGSMIGYMVSSVIYRGAMQVYEEAIESRKRRDQIHLYVIEAKKRLEIEEKELNRILEERKIARKRDFSKGFRMMHEGEKAYDSDLFVQGLASIAYGVGAELQFSCFSEFDDFMNDPNTCFEF